jgi:predicted permease
MHAVLQDFRYALRIFRHARGPTAIAVAALALGTAGSTTVFSFVNAVLLRPLPYRDPASLVSLTERRNQDRTPVSAANFGDWEQRNTVFDSLAFCRAGAFTLSGVADPQQVYGGRVSANFFSTLGTETLLGRVFLPQDTLASSTRVAVLSYSLWKRAFGGDPNVIGRALAADIDEGYLIIGVLPPAFWFELRELEIWVPERLSSENLADRAARNLTVIGRLKSGVPLRQAQAAMDVVAGSLARQFPKENGGWSVSVRTLHDDFARFVRRPLVVLFGAVAFVLLIACATAASVLLARAAARRNEIAIRAALGASRARIVRQLLTESLLLAVAAAALGLVLAWCGARALPALLPTTLPIPFPGRDAISIDGAVLAYTLTIAMLTAMLFGLAPAIHAARMNAAGARRSRGALVIAQIAISLVLLAGAGLMLRSFAVLERLDVGVRPENLLCLRIPLARTHYPDRLQRIAFYRQLLDRFSVLPGVDSASMVNYLPLTGERRRPVEIEGAAASDPPRVNDLIISPNYFRASGVSQHQGRDFDGRDTETSAPVCIVSELMARRFWPRGDALGKRMRLRQGPWLTVVGIVGDVRYWLTEEPQPAMYRPYRQEAPGSMNFALRTRTKATAQVTAVRGAVHALDRDQAIADVGTLEEILSNQVWQQRLGAVLLGLFAAIALALAGAGIYGVMSYTVAQRTREIGIRMAIGAAPEHIRKLILRRAFVLTAAGVLIGLAAARGIDATDVRSAIRCAARRLRDVRVCGGCAGGSGRAGGLVTGEPRDGDRALRSAASRVNHGRS